MKRVLIFMGIFTAGFAASSFSFAASSITALDSPADQLSMLDGDVIANKADFLNSLGAFEIKASHKTFYRRKLDRFGVEEIKSRLMLLVNKPDLVMVFKRVSENLLYDRYDLTFFAHDEPTIYAFLRLMDVYNSN